MDGGEGSGESVGEYVSFYCGCGEGELVVTLLRMKGIIFLLLICFSISCTEKTKETIQADELSQNCKLTITIYGSPWDTRYTAMFKLADKFGDTLIVSRCQKTGENDSCNYKKVRLDKNAKDSLYANFQKIKTNFKLSDEQSHVRDGTKVMISISSPTTAVSYSYSGIGGISGAGPDVVALVKFINAQLPGDFQME
jgi:hypothetical protein